MDYTEIEMLDMLRQLSRPVDYDSQTRRMFDYSLLKINRDFRYFKGSVYLFPGVVLKRVGRLGEISRSIKT